jgi:hypothetical protein
VKVESSRFESIEDESGSGEKGDRRSRITVIPPLQQPEELCVAGLGCEAGKRTMFGAVSVVENVWTCPWQVQTRTRTNTRQGPRQYQAE